MVQAFVFGPVAGDGDRVGAGPVHFFAAEDVLANQAAALGDAELIGDVADRGVGEARRLGAQPVRLGHDLLAAGQFGVGQVVRVGRIDLARDALGRAPRQQYLILADSLETPGAGRPGRVFDAAHREPEPGQHLLGRVRGPGRGEDVAVAAGVDHHVGQHREAARLGLERDAGHPVAVHERLAGICVQQQLHPGVFHHLVEGELEFLRVVGDGVADAVRAVAPHQPPRSVARHERLVRAAPFASVGKDCGPAAGEAVGDFLTQAADDLPAAAVVERQQQNDHAARGEPAQIAEAFHEQYVGTGARRGDRRGHAGGAAAHDEHLGFGLDRRGAGRFFDEAERLRHTRRLSPSPAPLEGGRKQATTSAATT